jgi:hypothetical protein
MQASMPILEFGMLSEWFKRKRPETWFFCNSQQSAADTAKP